MFKEYWIGWVYAGMGAIAIAFIKFCWKPIGNGIKKAFNLLKNSKKAEYLSEVNKKIEDNNNAMNQKIQEVQQNLEAFKEISLGADQEHEEQMDKILDGISALQKGILSSHFNLLLNKSMEYIKRGWISVEELELYEEELIVYKKLGGNGHLDPWIEKVRKLPNKKRRENS